MLKKENNEKTSTEISFEEIRFERVDLIIEHKLHDVTPEILDWWWKNMINPGNYKLWHPKDHVPAEREVPPTKDGKKYWSNPCCRGEDR